MDNKITFAASDESKAANAQSGTARQRGEHGEGREERLRAAAQLVGVGYRAQAQGNKLNLTLGFSHPIVHALPEGVKAETPTQTEIIIKGVDRQKVGQVAAEMRAYKPPEPYKGKGVRYVGEVVPQRDEEEVSERMTMDKKIRDCAAPPRRACASRARMPRASRCTAPTCTSTPR